mmetsp:Transcript_28692/g.95245  ORF Transcript_28692/g.95245 Transcript_28692/m.95245 type:complete len:661 (+) Transcript_28692:592-2574(+)
MLSSTVLPAIVVVDDSDNCAPKPPSTRSVRFACLAKKCKASGTLNRSSKASRPSTSALCQQPRRSKLRAWSPLRGASPAAIPPALGKPWERLCMFWAICSRFCSSRRNVDLKSSSSSTFPWRRGARAGTGGTSKCHTGSRPRCCATMPIKSKPTCCTSASKEGTPLSKIAMEMPGSRTAIEPVAPSTWPWPMTKASFAPALAARRLNLKSCQPMPTSKQRPLCSHSSIDSTCNLRPRATAASEAPAPRRSSWHKARAEARRPRPAAQAEPSRSSGRFGSSGSVLAGQHPSSSCQDSHSGGSTPSRFSIALFLWVSRYSKSLGNGRPSMGLRITQAMRASSSGGREKAMSLWRSNGSNVARTASAVVRCPVTRRSRAAAATPSKGQARLAQSVSCGASAIVSSIRFSLQKRFAFIFFRGNGLARRAVCSSNWRMVTPCLPCCANSGQTCQTGVSNPTHAPTEEGRSNATNRHAISTTLLTSRRGIKVPSRTPSAERPAFPKATLHAQVSCTSVSLSTAICAPTMPRDRCNASSFDSTAACRLKPPCDEIDRASVGTLLPATSDSAWRSIGSANDIVTFKELHRPWSMDKARVRNKSTPGMLSKAFFGSFFLGLAPQRTHPPVPFFPFSLTFSSSSSLNRFCSSSFSLFLASSPCCPSTPKR